MSSTPSIPRATASPLQQVLRRLVRWLLLLLGARRLEGREAWLRGQLDGLPAGHRRRKGLEAELAKLLRSRAAYEDAAYDDDPRLAGLLAEIARVVNDPGRRAVPRRLMCPNWFFALPGARPGPRAVLEAPEERCTTTIRDLLSVRR